MINNCWTNIGTVFFAAYFCMPSVHQNFCALLLCFGDVFFNSFLRCLIDHCAQVFAGDYLSCFITNFINDAVNISYANHCTSRHAALACATAHGGGYVLCRHARDGIGQNQQMIFCATQSQAAFKRSSSSLVNQFRNLG